MEAMRGPWPRDATIDGRRRGARALVAGWFSFEWMGATAGDLMVRDVTCRWLDGVGREYDVAMAPPFTGGVDWRAVDPAAYSHVIFVCGPFGNGEPVTAFLERFAGARRIGLNLSMLQPLEEWNPFDLLIERDSSAAANPDMSMAAERARVPVVGKILVHVQREYGDRGRHDVVHAAIERLLAERPAAIVPIDTRLDVENAGGLRTSAEIDALIGRMDVVVTTRLHGTVLALRNGVPVVAVDPVAGGAKVSRQARALGWRVVLVGDEATDAALEQAFAYCLTAAARIEARACAVRAEQRIEEMRLRFVREFTGGRDA